MQDRFKTEKQAKQRLMDPNRVDNDGVNWIHPVKSGKGKRYDCSKCDTKKARVMRIPNLEYNARVHADADKFLWEVQYSKNEHTCGHQGDAQPDAAGGGGTAEEADAESSRLSDFSEPMRDEIDRMLADKSPNTTPDWVHSQLLLRVRQKTDSLCGMKVPTVIQIKNR